jgi:hypothetical protein
MTPDTAAAALTVRTSLDGAEDASSAASKLKKPRKKPMPAFVSVAGSSPSRGPNSPFVGLHSPIGDSTPIEGTIPAAMGDYGLHYQGVADQENEVQQQQQQMNMGNGFDESGTFVGTNADGQQSIVPGAMTTGDSAQGKKKQRVQKRKKMEGVIENAAEGGDADVEGGDDVGGSEKKRRKKNKEGDDADNVVVGEDGQVKEKVKKIRKKKVQEGAGAEGSNVDEPGTSAGAGTGEGTNSEAPVVKVKKTRISKKKRLEMEAAAAAATAAAASASTAVDGNLANQNAEAGSLEGAWILTSLHSSHTASADHTASTTASSHPLEQQNAAPMNMENAEQNGNFVVSGPPDVLPVPIPPIKKQRKRRTKAEIEADRAAAAAAAAKGGVVVVVVGGDGDGAVIGDDGSTPRISLDGNALHVGDGEGVQVMEGVENLHADAAAAGVSEVRETISPLKKQRKSKKSLLAASASMESDVSIGPDGVPVPVGTGSGAGSGVELVLGEDGVATKKRKQRKSAMGGVGLGEDGVLVGDVEHGAAGLNGGEDGVAGRPVKLRKRKSKGGAGLGGAGDGVSLNALVAAALENLKQGDGEAADSGDVSTFSLCYFLAFLGNKYVYVTVLDLLMALLSLAEYGS